MIQREDLKKLCRDHVKLVPTHSSHRQRLMYLLGLFVLVILLLLPIFFHHHKTKPKNVTAPEHQPHYRSALEANLARLHQFENVQHTPIKPVRIALPRSVHSSKVQQLRQHAPTRMYAARSSNTVRGAHRTAASLLDRSTYASFANQTSQVPLVIAKALAHPRFTIPQGEFIHAILETAIDSDLPGMIRAVVSRPVYSYLGDRLLIPKGARLIGQYSSKTLQGIHRVMVIWQRILLPNGISVQLDSPGSDALGDAGFRADRVNTHFFQRFGEASLLSLMGAASANWGVNDSDGDNAMQRYRSAISQSFQSSASQSLKHASYIKPTLRIHQGSRVIVFVARDLDFYSAIEAHVN